MSKKKSSKNKAIYNRNKNTNALRASKKPKPSDSTGPFRIDPVFDANAVAVVFQTSNLFCPYAAVTIQSIIDTATQRYNYDIIVTSLDIDKENAEIISGMADGKPNISIRVFNISEYRKQYPLEGNRRFGSETWTRVFLADLMPRYSKVIDLDSDMIIRKDIGELFRTDISKHYLAGVQDYFAFYSYYGTYISGKFKTYLKSKIGLDNIRDYVNAGCLIFNLEKIRQDYPLKDILKIIEEKKFDILEQDTFNYMFKGGIKHLDMSWNFLVDTIGVIGYADKDAPDDFKLLHDKAEESIKIIHYAAPEKPWDYPENPYALYFWECARRTPYYSCLLYRMAGNQQKRLSMKLTKLPEPETRKLADKVLPKGTKRREFVKKLLSPFRKKA